MRIQGIVRYGNALSLSIRKMPFPEVEYKAFYFWLPDSPPYGGSVGALKAMGALDMGLSEDELAPLVKAWRESNPNIVRLWWAVDDAVMKAVREKATTRTHGITFTVRSGMLFMVGGREL